MNETQSRGSIQVIVERAAADPNFLKRLAQDPTGTIQAEGYQVDSQDVKALLDMPDASDQEAAEALQARLSHSMQLAAYSIGPIGLPTYP